MMMSETEIQEIVKAIVGVRWKWPEAHLADVARDLGAQIKERIGEGSSYRQTCFFNNGAEIDFYVNDGMIDFAEVTLDIYHDPHLLSLFDYDQKVDEFYEKFESVVATAENLLKKAEFCDGAAATGFPDDQDAIWLALWRIPNARFMVQQKHEDRDLPFRVCLVICPP